MVAPQIAGGEELQEAGRWTGSLLYTRPVWKNWAELIKVTEKLENLLTGIRKTPVYQLVSGYGSIKRSNPRNGQLDYCPAGL